MLLIFNDPKILIMEHIAKLVKRLGLMIAIEKVIERIEQKGAKAITARAEKAEKENESFVIKWAKLF